MCWCSTSCRTSTANWCRKFEKLKPGVRLVLHDYGLEGFEADQSVRVTSNEDGRAHTLFLTQPPSNPISVTGYSTRNSRVGTVFVAGSLEVE